MHTRRLSSSSQLEALPPRPPGSRGAPVRARWPRRGGDMDSAQSLPPALSPRVSIAEPRSTLQTTPLTGSSSDVGQRLRASDDPRRPPSSVAAAVVHLPSFHLHPNMQSSSVVFYLVLRAERSLDLCTGRGSASRPSTRTLEAPLVEPDTAANAIRTSVAGIAVPCAAVSRAVLAGVVGRPRDFRGPMASSSEGFSGAVLPPLSSG